MINNYNCSDCPYCQASNDFFTRWCSYWDKVTFLTDCCTRETTVLDDDYDFDLDDDDL